MNKGDRNGDYCEKEKKNSKKGSDWLRGEKLLRREQAVNTSSVLLTKKPL